MAERPKPQLDQRFALAMRGAAHGQLVVGHRVGARRVGRATLPSSSGWTASSSRARSMPGRRALHPDDREWVAQEIGRTPSRSAGRFGSTTAACGPTARSTGSRGVGEMVLDETARSSARPASRSTSTSAGRRRKQEHEALLEGERAARLESEQARQRAERLQLISAGLAARRRRAETSGGSSSRSSSLRWARSPVASRSSTQRRAVDVRRERGQPSRRT